LRKIFIDSLFGFFKESFMAKKIKEPQFCMSAINNPMLNYKVYYFSKMEKLLFSLALIVVGGMVGLIFYGGLLKRMEMRRQQLL
jgi:hypothetical protein